MALRGTLTIDRASDSINRLEVQTFASAREFLKNPPPKGPACLLLDVRMPGLSGMDLQRELARSEIRIPIIFITAHGAIPMSMRANHDVTAGCLCRWVFASCGRGGNCPATRCRGIGRMFRTLASKASHYIR